MVWKYQVEKRTEKARSYDVTLLGGVWIPTTRKRPVYAVWLSDQGAANPIKAGIHTGTQWELESYTRHNDLPKRIEWGKTDPPQLFMRNVSEDGGYTETVATYPNWISYQPTCVNEDGDVQFVILQSQDQLSHHSHHVSNLFLQQLSDGRPFEEDDPVANYFMSYADLLTLYLIKRVKWPILTGRLPRAIMLAAALHRGYARFQSDTMSWRKHMYRDNCEGLIAPGMKELGYADALYIEASSEQIEELCTKVPRHIAETWGEEWLTSQDLPQLFQENM